MPIHFLTTLCYIRNGSEWLMLHRTKKKADVNRGKWIGVGGKFEPGESPDDCLLREVREETGLTLTDYRYRGVITFIYNDNDPEYMHLYTADGFTGALTACSEGTLRWVPGDEITRLNLWAGDRIFLRLLLRDEPCFSLKLVYSGDDLIRAVLNGRTLELSEISAF